MAANQKRSAERAEKNPGSGRRAIHMTARNAVLTSNPSRSLLTKRPQFLQGFVRYEAAEARPQ